MNIQEIEEMEFTRSSDSEWDRFDTELGAFNNNNTTSAWILSDRDCWYPNPFYQGPPQPHPEDVYYDEEAEAYRPSEPLPPAPTPVAFIEEDDDCPF